MRLFHTFLLAGAVVHALPPPTPDSTPRLSLPSSIKALALIHPSHSNLTTPPTLPDSSPVVCYSNVDASPVTRQSCHALIVYFVSNRDFRLPKLWVPGPREPEWHLGKCRLRIVSGEWDSRFSMQDVAVEMERVLATCQPPAYVGVGGSAPVAGVQRLMYAAFHVQVTGVRE